MTDESSQQYTCHTKTCLTLEQDGETFVQRAVRFEPVMRVPPVNGMRAPVAIGAQAQGFVMGNLTAAEYAVYTKGATYTFPVGVPVPDAPAEVPA